MISAIRKVLWLGVEQNVALTVVDARDRTDDEDRDHHRAVAVCRRLGLIVAGPELIESGREHFYTTRRGRLAAAAIDRWTRLVDRRWWGVRPPGGPPFRG